MNTRWMYVVLLGAVSCVCAEAAYTPPVVSVPLTTKAPQLDGRLEAAEWARAGVLSDFVLVGGASLPALPTTVYMQYDASNLYVGVFCSDPNPGGLKVEATRRDGAVLQDDCVELFFDTLLQRKDVAHLAVNAANVQFDAWNEDVTQDFKWTSAVQRLPDGWSVEIALPFAQGIGPKVGDTWLMNVGRSAPGLGEKSCWVATTNSFMELDRLGTLIFSGPPFRVSLRGLGDLWLGQNLAQVEVASLTGGSAPLAAKLNARVEGAFPANGSFNAVKIKVSTEPTVWEVPYRVPGDGLSTVIFSVTDEKGTAAWRSAPYPVNIPPLTAALQRLERALSEALVIWSRLEAGEQRESLAASLTEMQTAWEGINARVLAQRQIADRTQYASLLAEVDFLAQAAEALKAQAVAATAAE